MKNNKAKLILASGSPRRKELMSKAGYEFTVVTADVDETVPENTPPYEAVQLLSKKKAQAVLAHNPDSIVIGADTVVAADGEILGKPADSDDAFRMLKMLSGKVHRVYTGVTVASAEKCVTFYDETGVEFYKLSDREVYDYISTGEPADKAGAYGIQEKGCLLVKRIDGDFFNVMGLPIAKLYRELEDFLNERS